MATTDLVSVLLWVAQDLEERHGYQYAGAIRRGAARLQAIEATAIDRDPNSCARCGAPLKQRSTGRPRKWCSESCRRKVTETQFLSKVSRKESRGN